MKFNVNATALNAALEVVSIVTPSPVTAQGGAGYLFVINAERKCSVYSKDANRIIKVDMPVTDVDGEGAFIFPSNHVEEFRHFKDVPISFEAKKDDAGNFTIAFDTESGATAEHATFDPNLMITHTEKRLNDAKDAGSFGAGLLREAMSMAKTFVQPSKETQGKEQFKTLQIFDANGSEDWKNGDGYMFAADGVRACFFYSEALKGKGLAIHNDHIPVLISYLAKCEGDVSLKVGEDFTFAVNSLGAVLGWANRTTTHGKFKYYSLKLDNYNLSVPKVALLNALKFVRSSLDKKKDKVRFIYTAKPEPRVQFTASDSTSKSNSFFVPVQINPGEKSLAEEKDFSIGVNLDHFIDLVDGIRGNEFELRVMVVPAKESEKEKAAFRTIDTFSLTQEGKTASITDKDVVPCVVTRFMPSKE